MKNRQGPYGHKAASTATRNNSHPHLTTLTRFSKPDEIAQCIRCGGHFRRPRGAAWMTHCRPCHLWKQAGQALAIASRSLKEAERL